MTASPGRRRTREELRDLVVGTGVELAHEEGIGTGADHLTFKRVFDRLEETTGVRVTNASVIGRVWDSIDDYRRDVLAAVASHDEGALLRSIMDECAEAFASFDRSTPEARQASLAQAVRIGCNLSQQALAASSTWRLQIGVWALAMTGFESSQLGPIRQAVAAAYRATMTTTVSNNRTIAGYLGFRPREPATIEEFSLAADALGEGFALRLATGIDEPESVLLPTGPGGADQEWTLYALAVHALIRDFLEIDPEWTPDESPSAWTDGG